MAKFRPLIMTQFSPLLMKKFENCIEPSQILANIKREHPNAAIQIQDIYNLRTKVRLYLLVF